MTRWIAIVDESEGRLATAFLEDEPSCNAREYGDLCGGCRTCMIRQAEHYGYKILYGLDESGLAELEVELSSEGVPLMRFEPVEPFTMRWADADGDRVVGVDLGADGDHSAAVVMRREPATGVLVVEGVVTVATPPRAGKRASMIEAMKAMGGALASRWGA